MNSINNENNSNDRFVPVSNIIENDNTRELLDYFFSKFGFKPTFVVRVPGRVNLIGEHIDYCGYPVMPMALNQDILMAVKMHSDLFLNITNVNCIYKDFSTTMDKISIMQSDSSGPAWHNYILCGIQGAMEALPTDVSLKGASIAISGNVPPASGLSSSSALVSAAALAILFGHGEKLTKNELASICARCERYIGTEGGGMDQAIAFLAVQGCAQYITWDPVRAFPITLPPNAAFVVAHSLVEANKAATSDFNHRVAECRLAAKVIAKKTGVYEQLKKFTLFELQCKLNSTLEDMIILVKRHLNPQPYSRNELCELLEITYVELNEKHLTANVTHIAEFKLYQRALHVFEEALRVEIFKNTCIELAASSTSKINKSNGLKIDKNEELHIFNRSNDCKNNDNSTLNFKQTAYKTCDYIQTLGNLMRESHKSLQHFYECSHPNLDRLVELSDEFGAYARLTGAGWGGCIVAICPLERTQEYVSMLHKKFYNILDTKGRKVSSLVFVTTPKQGAEIFVTMFD